MNKHRKWLTMLALWLLAMVAHAGTVTYVYTDPQGTPLAEANANGAIIATYDYAPYGQAVASMSGAPDGPGYTGHVNDPETGLVYMQARYYDPGVGLFLSVDPVGVQPGNIFNVGRFIYASNNPIMLFDPTGKSPKGGKDMEICDGPVPCDSGGPARVFATSPFTTNRDVLKYLTSPTNPYPSRFKVLDSFKDVSCSECFDVWRYGLTNEAGTSLNGSGYSVMEHIEPLLAAGSAVPITSENRFVPMEQGIAYDQVGLTPGAYANLRSTDTGVSIYRQTFSVKYQGVSYPLSTVFYHKISWQNLGVSTTTHVVRP